MRGSSSSAAALSSYNALLRRLSAINESRNMSAGVASIRALLSVLPPEIRSCISTYPMIHIAGSNGKGSVAHKLSRALSLSGLITGAYTSPHLSSIRERITLDGNMIERDELTRIVTRVLDAADAASQAPTLFDLMSVATFAWFDHRRVDCGVIECGVGGRDDSTNVITPIVSIITAVSLEHTRLLGNTLDEIATAKCGIIKQNIPVVTGPSVPLHIVERFASEMNAPHTRVTGIFATSDDENTAIAKAAYAVISKSSPLTHRLRTDNAKLESAFSSRPPCRYELVEREGIPIVLDVAHNPAAIARLMQRVRDDYSNHDIHVIYASSDDKDVVQCLNSIMAISSTVHFAAASSSRSMSPHMLRKLAADNGLLDRYQQCAIDQSNISHVSEVIDRVLAQPISTTKPSVIVICGTFFIFRSVRVNLGLISDDDTDGIDLNESKRASHTDTPR